MVIQLLKNELQRFLRWMRSYSIVIEWLCGLGTWDLRLGIFEGHSVIIQLLKIVED